MPGRVSVWEVGFANFPNRNPARHDALGRFALQREIVKISPALRQSGLRIFWKRARLLGASILCFLILSFLRAYHRDGYNMMA